MLISVVSHLFWFGKLSYPFFYYMYVWIFVSVKISENFQIYFYIKFSLNKQQHLKSLFISKTIVRCFILFCLQRFWNVLCFLTKCNKKKCCGVMIFFYFKFVRWFFVFFFKQQPYLEPIYPTSRIKLKSLNNKRLLICSSLKLWQKMFSVFFLVVFFFLISSRVIVRNKVLVSYECVLLSLSFA